MAKKTKDSNLSLEERLEQALIPNWDEPYKLPENWCWIKIGSINNYNGHSIDPTNTPTDTFELYSVPSSDNNYPEILMGNEIGSTKQSVEKDDVLLCKINPRINRVWKVAQHTQHTLLASSEWIIVRNKHINSDYLMWCLKSPYFREFMLSNVSGIGGSLMRAQPKHVQHYPIPLPPRPEQKRIVNHIESIFAKLDDAKEKAQEVVDGFENRKAAILHKAFSGELTKKWREERRVTKNEWRNLTLDDVAEYKKGPFGSSITKAMFVPKGPNTYKVYEQGNAIRKTLEYGSYYISQSKYDELKGFAIRPGDIIVSCAGTIGEIYKLPNNCEAGVINQALMRVRTYDNIDELYFIHYFSGVLKGDVIDEANGTAIKNIPPFKILKAMNILLPSLSEQKEIVDVLDRMLSKEQHAKETAELVIEQIDTMKKAILARAFHGELGTNDPSEESAVELLKNVLGEDVAVQTPAKNPTKRISIPSYIKDLLSNIREEEIIKLLLKSAPQSVSVQEIMALSAKKFELMDALRSLEKKQLITKNESGKYSLTR